jgi:hypothetical protein
MSNTPTARGFKIRISDHKLNIKQKINNVPYKDIWPREVVFNMFQATLAYIRNTSNIKIDRPVEITVKALEIKDFWDDVKKTAPKLCFYNLGGMDANQLEESCHINSNVQDNGKTHGEDGCFGQGEKMCLLNFTDILKMSYKNGVGHYYIMTNATGEPAVPYGIEPIDVDWLNTYKDELGVDLNHDWTLTIILGKPGTNNLKHQNTVTHPHDPEGDKEVGHLTKKLFQRLYDFPSNEVDLRFITDKKGDQDKTPHSAGRNPGERMPFLTTSQVWNKVTKAHPESFVETVTDDEGFKYHFYYDAPNKNNDPSSKGATQNFGTLNFMSLIHGPIGERERYDLQFTSTRWRGLSSRFGIYQDEKFFRVDIELPCEKYEPYGNREGVTLKKKHGGDGRIMTYESFINQAVLVKSKAEKWSAKVQEHKSKIQKLDLEQAIKDKLKDFFADIEHSGNSKKGKGSGLVNPNPNPKPNPNPSPNPKPYIPRPKMRGSSMPTIPEVIENAGKTDGHFAVFEELGEKGKPILFINPTHQVVNKKLNQVNHDEDLELDYRKAIRDRLGINLAVKILIAKAFRDSQTNGMDHEKFKSTIDPTQLTLQAYYDEDVIKELRTDKVMKAMKEEATNNKKLGVDLKIQAEWNQVQGYRPPITQ